MSHIILSTRNPSKAEQIKAIFKDSLVIIQTLDDAGIEGEAVEDGLTLAENALKKARYAQERMEVAGWTMADDTGFFIEALSGAPGIKAARWAGEQASTLDITNHTLNMLQGHTNRKAYFKTVVAVVAPAGKEYFFSGRVIGRILETPRCEPQPKMPYSGIFVPDGSDKVWAEMTVHEENAISHRGIAFNKARDFLELFHR